MKRERMIAALLCSAAMVVTACGDDDESASTDAADTETAAAATSPASDAPTTEAAATDPPSTDPPATDASATDPPASAPPTTEASVDTFCQAELDVEEAVQSQDPKAIEPAFAALQEAATEDISGAVETAVSEASKFLAEDGPPTPEFDDAYGEVVAFVSDNCGFGELDVLAKDYSFGGIGPEVPAGPTVVNLINEGIEVHEIVLVRKNDGVTESFDELLAMPQKQAFKKTSDAGGAFAFPDEEGHLVVDLEPGEYIALCFVPEGTTPEVVAEADAGGPEPEGAPHFMEGMKHEFVVP